MNSTFPISYSPKHNLRPKTTSTDIGIAAIWRIAVVEIQATSIQGSALSTPNSRGIAIGARQEGAIPDGDRVNQYQGSSGEPHDEDAIVSG